MMKSIVCAAAILSGTAGTCLGQFGGNITYGQPGARARAEQRERAKRTITDQERPPTGSSTFVEADVLVNVRADEFVAVFGIAQEGETPEDCARKMDATVARLKGAIAAVGPKDDDVYVDFVAQSRIYGFEFAGEIAREKPVGFELKKNLSARFRDRSLIEPLVRAAARADVHDLIKVDYVVRDVGAVQDRLMEEASKVIKRKVERYDRLLGIKLRPPAQIYAERYATYAPTEMYDSYAATDSESILGPAERQRFTVQAARKGRTSVYNGLDGDGFDRAIDPVLIEPVVQFTLYLKVKYDVEPPAPK